MGMTMTQKILAAHAGLDHVEAGQLILVNLDRVPTLPLRLPSGNSINSVRITFLTRTKLPW